MSFLPVAERELRIRARQPGTYRLRMVIVGLGALILLGAMVSFRSSPAAVGGDMFHSFTVLAALFCLYEGARLTSDSLSEELREGTMGLLFLTRLQPYGILAGKLVSAGLSSFYGLMALFPVASLPLLMGGVTGTEVWRTMLALMNLLFFALAAGMAVSAYARDQFNAWAGTGLLLVLVCFLPTALSALLPGRVNFLEQLTPLSNCLAAASPGSSASKFWQGILAGQIFAWLFLFVAGGALKRR